MYQLSDFYALLLLISAGVSATAAAIIWKRRHVTSAVPLLVLMLALVIWSLTYAIYWLSTSPGRLFWLDATYLGVVLVPAAFFVFVLSYTHQEHWVTRFTLALLAVEPALTLLLLWTDPWHGLFFGGLRTADTSTILAGGPWFSIQVVYSYSLILVGCFLLAQFFLRAQKPYRRQAGMLLFGSLLPWFGNMISLAHLNPLSDLDLTPIAFTLTGIIFAYNLFHNHLLDLVPIARSKVFETLQDGVVIIDPQQRIVDMNPAARELLQAIAQTANPPTLGQPIRRYIEAWPDWVAQGDEGQESETEIADLRGKRSYYGRRISTLVDGRGRPQGKVLLLSDITARKQAEEQQRTLEFEHERQRIMSGFLKDAAHEFKTPLTVIRTSSYLLRRAGISQEHLKRIDTIEEQGELMNRLVDDLLTLLRFQDLSMLHTQEVDLHQVIRGAASRIHTSAEKKAVTISLAFGEQPLLCCCDYDQVERAVRNLIENAVRYTNPGGQVTIQTAHHEDWQTIRIADTGIGIEPENLRQIFNSFFRIDKAHSTPGLGLGLAIVQRVVANHGGRITVKSAPGQGSVFEITFPETRQPDKTTNWPVVTVQSTLDNPDSRDSWNAALQDNPRHMAP